MLTLTVFGVLTRLLGFLYKIYLSRIMSTYELGVYSLTLSVYMVLITIVASSIPLTISKITSNNKSLNKEMNTKYSVTSALILSLVVASILTIVILLSKPLIITILGGTLGYNVILTLIPSLLFTALYSQIRGFLWGYENYFSVSIVEFIEQILRIVFCMLFVSLKIFSSPAISVGIALSIACGISTIYGYYLYFKNNGRFSFKKGFFKDIIKSTLPLTAVRILGSLMQPIVAIVLPIILTNYGMLKEIAVSELGVVMGMSMPLISIPSTIIGSLCMILIPRISSYHSNDTNTLNKQFDNYFDFCLMCIMLFIPIFIVLGIPICELVFDNSLAGIYLSQCAWIMLPMGVAQITTSILNALNQEQKTFIYYVVSSVFMFIGILLLSKLVGSMSMLYGIGISNVVLAIFNIIKIKKLTKYTTKITKKIFFQLFLTLPIILIIKLTYNWVLILTNNFVAISMCSIISVCGYMLLMITFNIVDLNIFKTMFLKNLKKTKTKNSA